MAVWRCVAAFDLKTLVRSGWPHGRANDFLCRIFIRPRLTADVFCMVLFTCLHDAVLFSSDAGVLVATCLLLCWH